MSLVRTRWAAFGAAVAITLGAGGIGLVSATIDSGERPVLIQISPCRVTDTRPGADNVGPKASPLGAGEIHTITAHGDNGDCTGIPADATGLSLNVTAVDATQQTYLTIWATGDPQPATSNLNPSPGQPPIPNAVTTEVSPAGQFDIFNESGTVDVIVDINGYYAHHNHDDLYYTKDQADSRFQSATPTEITVNPASMQPSAEGSEWTFESVGWSHNSDIVGNQCVFGPIDLPPGTDVTGLSLVYFAPLGSPQVFVGLRGTRRVPGDVISSDQTIAAASFVADSTPTAAFKSVPFGPTGQPDVRADFNYSVTVCTPDLLWVSGIHVTVG